MELNYISVQGEQWLNRRIDSGGRDMIKSSLLLFLIMLLSTSVYGRELAGVDVPETINKADATVLQLNGAGIRSKFFFKIYIAGLYLTEKERDASAIFAQDRDRRLVMHFLYDEVGKKDLVEAWNEGFKGNGSPEQLTELSSDIATFNSLFDTVKKGDQIILDYTVGKGTDVIIRGEKRGTIEGKPFNDLLLSIWLGEAPVGKGLRDDLLGKQ